MRRDTSFLSSFLSQCVCSGLSVSPSLSPVHTDAVFFLFFSTAAAAELPASIHVYVLANKSPEGSWGSSDCSCITVKCTIMKTFDWSQKREPVVEGVVNSV